MLAKNVEYKDLRVKSEALSVESCNAEGQEDHVRHEDCPPRAIHVSVH